MSWFRHLNDLRFGEGIGHFRNFTGVKSSDLKRQLIVSGPKLGKETDNGGKIFLWN
jgi:hypothetical protein